MHTSTSDNRYIVMLHTCWRGQHGTYIEMVEIGYHGA